MRVFVLLCSACLILASATASHAQVRFALSPYGGTTSWAGNLGLSNGLLLGGRASAMVIPWLGIEGSYGFSLTETNGAEAAATDA